MASSDLPADKSNDHFLVLILNDLSEIFNRIDHSFFHLASKMLYSFCFPLSLYVCVPSIPPLLVPPLLPGPLTSECPKAQPLVLLCLYIQLDDFIQYHNFKYHLCAFGTHISISSPVLSLEHQIQISSYWDFPGGTVVKNLPAMQGTRVRALVREEPTCHGATKPVHHNY